MKKICFCLVTGIILFTGCYQTKAVQYNVDPDKVFGQHYTAKDFGIWYLLSYSDNLYSSLVNETMERLPADLWQKFTAANVHKRIGMMLGTDRLLSAPQIMCEIAGGACCVSGPEEDECYAIATVLQGDKYAVAVLGTPVYFSPTINL